MQQQGDLVQQRLQGELIHEDQVGDHRNVDEKDADPGRVLTKCNKHNGEIIKLFCADHDDVVCNLCAQVDHRKCSDLKHIAGIIGNLDKDLKSEAAEDNLKSATGDIDRVIVGLDRHLDKQTMRKHRLIDEIEDYTMKILVKVKEMKDKAVNDVTSKHDQLVSSAKEKRQTCLVMKRDIDKNIEDIRAPKTSKSDAFILIKRGQILAKNVKTLCQESIDLMKGSRLAFRPEKRIEVCLNEFTSMAIVEDMYRATLKSSADVSVDGDKNKSCCIEGCCLLNNGTVLLVDCDNKRLKKFDPSTRTVMDHCKLKGYLWGISQISPQEVGVGTWSHALQIVSFGAKLTHTTTLRLHHDCSSLVQSRGELFVTDGDTLYVHDVTGKLLRTIYQNDSGEKMFADIRGIAASSTGDMIYIADSDNGLVCVDREGRERFRCSNEELGLSGAPGVCTDNAGNVFVCGLLSNNVVQVSEDGRVLGEILTKSHGIVWPQCLCFDSETYTLYVGGMTSKLQMFKLE